MAIDYSERIPNNVGLADNRTLQRALEQWQPRFLDWWQEMGPAAFGGTEVTRVRDRRPIADDGECRQPDVDSHGRLGYR